MTPDEAFRHRNQEFLDQGQTAVVCRHGYARSWTGLSKLGDKLPPIEFCPRCDKDTVELP